MDVKSQPNSSPNRWICIYPLYLNSKKTLAEGRRIKKEKAVENPTSQEIFDILQHAGLNCRLERNKIHPLDANRDLVNAQGRVRIQLKNDDDTFTSQFKSRLEIMLHAAEMIPKLKTRQSLSNSSAPASSISGGANKKKGKK